MDRDYNEKNILFICTGNTCRSPMAATIFNNMIQDGTWHAFSRGLVVLFPEPSNPKAELVLDNHGMRLENHVAVQLAKEDCRDAAYIFTMTLHQKHKVEAEYPGIQNLYTVKEFVHEDGDVPDPYGGDLVDYENCYGNLSRIIKKLVIKLNEEKVESDAENDEMDDDEI